MFTKKDDGEMIYCDKCEKCERLSCSGLLQVPSLHGRAKTGGGRAETGGGRAETAGHMMELADWVSRKRRTTTLIRRQVWV